MAAVLRGQRVMRARTRIVQNTALGAGARLNLVELSSS